jgi:hypothetical protein
VCCASTQIETESEHFVFVAKLNERIRQIAKELGHGCTADEIVALNAANPVCDGVKTSSKLKAHTRVWLPVRACHAYLRAAARASDDDAGGSTAAAARAWLDGMDAKRRELDKNRTALDGLCAGPLANHLPRLRAELQTLEDELTRHAAKKRKLDEALAEHVAALEAERRATERRLCAQTALDGAWRA